MNGTMLTNVKILRYLLYDPDRFVRKLRKTIVKRWAQKSCGSEKSFVMVFHRGRCGSTVLSEQLDQNPCIQWEGEVISKAYENRKKGVKLFKTPSQVTRYLKECTKRARTQIYGCEIVHHQIKLSCMGMDDYVSHLKGLGFSKFILMKRKNVLRQLVSARIAAAYNRYHRLIKEPAVLNRLKLEIGQHRGSEKNSSLIERLNDFKHCFDELENAFEGHELLTVTYEEHIADDPTEGYRRICDFLGVRYIPVRHGLAKTNPFPLQDIIINFDEVESELQGTAFEWMLYA